MDLILDILSWACIVAGAFFGVTGAVGLFRFPDFYSRVHAASITDTLSVGLIMVGIILQTDSWLMAAKLILIMLILAYTGPTAVHALTKSARQIGVKPVLDDKGDVS